MTFSVILTITASAIAVFGPFLGVKIKQNKNFVYILHALIRETRSLCLAWPEYHRRGSVGAVGAGVSPKCNEKTKKAYPEKFFKKQKGIGLERGEKAVTGTVKMALRMWCCAE